MKINVNFQDNVELPDIQKTEPEIAITIDKVGIDNLKIPFKIIQKNNELQSTIANVEMGVFLDKNQKGTHMSRFPITLYEFKNKLLNKKVLSEFAEKICERLESSKCFIKLDFDYFIQVESPVSKYEGLIDVHTQFEIKYNKNNMDKSRFTVSVTVPVISCCPCSKEISQMNAHNQRADVFISVTSKIDDDIIWIEDLVEIATKCASSRIYPILKRTDEKFVTEEMYENAYFVEDISRKVANELLNKFNHTKWMVKVVSYESIHRHNAIAEIHNYEEIE